MDRQSDILLESGTNELGVMEFTIGGEIFGINVAKVLEIMMACPVVPMQKAQKDIEGIFKSRDMLLTVIDLASYLGLPPSQNPGRDIFIITRFNNANFAFHVHTVVGIDRISWTEIKKPDRIIYGGQDGVATGIAEYNGRLITILDFEKSYRRSALKWASGMKIWISWVSVTGRINHCSLRRIRCFSPR